MRNTLALLAAFTLSTSSAVTAIACETSTQTTVTIFDWYGIINETRETSEDFFDYLLANPESGIGESLYKDIVDYISLSILKTNSTFKADYEFAKQSVENEIENIKNSLRAKYGRNWETKWKNFLKDPAQGGDGKTGSYQRYFDILLKGKANTIVSQYYVGDNYHNYQYYNSTEISIWLNDIYNFVKIKGKTVEQYANEGAYANKTWIVVDSTSGLNTKGYDALQKIIDDASSVLDIQLKYKVPKTKDDQPLNDNDDYLIDPSSTIKGLLSNQQTKIAQVWMKNQGPIWTRQIVIPFDDNHKGEALKKEIKEEDFENSKTTLKKVLEHISSKEEGGFESALKYVTDNIPSVKTSAESGDLGLVTLNSQTSNIKASFSYYLYRYVTSNQGIPQSKSTTAPFNLPEYKVENKDTDITNLINSINRTEYKGDNKNHTSIFNDLVWMKDEENQATSNKYSGSDNINKVAIFIDEDGIHFVQTPGIAYHSNLETEPTQKIITDYNQKIANKDTIKWEDAKKLADRPGGLTSNPYLDYLQTQYLLWNANSSDKAYFDLNDSLKQFTSGSSTISSDTWWDYILYFNNNMDNLHWNLPELLNDDKVKDASDQKVEKFVKSMKSWVTTTIQRRWNLHQGISNTDTLVKNINDLNKTWDGYLSPPPARMNAADIKNYLTNVAGQTIWWYDPNSIQN